MLGDLAEEVYRIQGATRLSLANFSKMSEDKNILSMEFVKGSRLERCGISPVLVM
jgi:hypothetical protein